MASIKPCPWCGAVPVPPRQMGVRAWCESRQRWQRFVWVECANVDCGVRPSVCATSKRECLRKWNRRVKA